MSNARLAILALATFLTVGLAAAPTAQAAVCAADCSGHGVCLDDGACACEPGYTGLDCSVAAPLPCPSDCSGRGVCQQGMCFCDSGWSGAACDVSPPCPGDCSGHGACVAGVCACAPGWEGLDCATATPVCPADCSGKGVCERGRCFCDPGYEGAACEMETPACPAACNGRGTCQFGKCFCQPGFEGAACESETAACPAACNGRGTCQFGQCFCQPGFAGDACETESPACPAACSGRGTCQLGKCFCDPGFEGDACEAPVAACPADCSGRGTCRFGQCFCKPGYAGKACESAVADVPIGQAAGVRAFWSEAAGALRVERDQADGAVIVQEVPLPRTLTDDPEFPPSLAARFPQRVDLDAATAGQDVVVTARHGGGQRCARYGQCMIFAARIPAPGVAPVGLPDGFAERFAETAPRLVRADYCGTGAQTERGAGPGRGGRGSSAVFDDYRGGARTPQIQPQGQAPAAAELRAALLGTPGFLASGADAVLLAWEGTDGGVAVEPATGRASWSVGAAEPVEFWTVVPVAAEGADQPADALCGTLLLAREGGDRSMVGARLVDGCLGLAGAVDFGAVLTSGAVELDPAVAKAIGAGFGGGSWSGTGTTGISGTLLLVQASSGARVDAGVRWAWSAGADGQAVESAAFESPRGVAPFVGLTAATLQAAADLRSPVVLAASDCRLLLADDRAAAPTLRAWDRCAGQAGGAALPADFLAVSDFVGGHFVDDWQGETVFLKASAELEPQAADACVPSLPVCADGACGVARLGAVPLSVTLGVRGTAGAEYRGVPVSVTLGARGKASVDFEVGLRSAPGAPPAEPDDATRRDAAQRAAVTYGTAAATTGALGAPLGPPRARWLTVTAAAFAKLPEGARPTVRATAWSQAGVDALEVGAGGVAGFSPEALCTAKDPFGGCAGAGLLPAAVVTRTVAVGPDAATGGWTTSESVGLAWRDRKDLSRAVACVIPVDPTSAEPPTLASFLVLAGMGAAGCADLETIDPDGYAATAAALGVTEGGRVRLTTAAATVEKGGGTWNFHVWNESFRAAGGAPGALPALAEALGEDVPLARVGGFDLRAVPTPAGDPADDAEERVAGGGVNGVRVIVQAPATADGARTLLAQLPLEELAAQADIGGAELRLGFDATGLLVEPHLQLAPAHGLAAACPQPGCQVDLLLPPAASFSGSAPRLRPLLDANDAFWRDRAEFPWARVRRLVRKLPQAPVPLAVGDAALATLSAPFVAPVVAAGGAVVVAVPVQDFELTPTCPPRTTCPVYRGQAAAVALHDAAGSTRLTAATLWSPDGTARETRLNALSERSQSDQELLQALDGNPALRVAQVTVTTEPTALAELLAGNVGDPAAQATGGVLTAPLGGGRTGAPERWLGAARATVFGAGKPDLLPAGATFFAKPGNGGGSFDSGVALAACGWAR